MNDSTKHRNRSRQTVTILPTLAAALDSGVCPGPSLGARIDTLAGRYMGLMSDPALLPANWPIDAWAALIRAVAVIDTRPPTATYSLAGYLRATKPHSKLAYAADSLSQANMHAMIALAERAMSVDIDNQDALSAFLMQSGVKIGSE